MTTEKQQTTLQKLIGKLEAFKEGYKMMGDYPENIDEAIEYAQSLLPEEKQMVIDAYMKGWNDEAEGYVFELSQKHIDETFEKP